MTYDRKTFLKMSGLLASGVTIGTLPFLSSCNSAPRNDTIFGLQLYTLRDVIVDDPEGTLREVADYGYKQIESYEGPMGMFWGMGNNGFKELMDELDMTIISSHANVFEDFERKANEAAEIDMKYIVSPWIGPQDSLDEYRQIADQFNEMGEIANDVGIRFAYHNHAYTFEEQEGQMPQDVLMENTDPDLVEYQMDIYWVVLAGHDPAEWARRYPGRFTSCHVKDLVDSVDPESTVLGRGVIDFQQLLPVLAEHGMEDFIVEQEAYRATTDRATPLRDAVMDAVRENAEYMRRLDI